MDKVTHSTRLSELWARPPVRVELPRGEVITERMARSIQRSMRMEGIAVSLETVFAAARRTWRTRRIRENT